MIPQWAQSRGQKEARGGTSASIVDSVETIDYLFFYEYWKVCFAHSLKILKNAYETVVYNKDAFV